jgi:hypothetical protein
MIVRAPLQAHHQTAAEVLILLQLQWMLTHVCWPLHLQVLVAAGMEAVLQEARDALQQLTGSCS